MRPIGRFHGREDQKCCRCACRRRRRCWSGRATERRRLIERAERAERAERERERAERERERDRERERECRVWWSEQRERERECRVWWSEIKSIH